MSRYYLPSLRGIFGDWVYYSCLMPMSDVVKRIRYADEMHQSEKLSEMIQRELKRGRALGISEYLRREDQRFFNSLVVAIYGGDPSWHGFESFRPMYNDIDMAEVPEDVENSVGFLSFNGEERIFALDGQHRLAGMRDALEKDHELGRDEVPLIVVAHRDSDEGRTRTRRLFTTLNKTAKPVGKREIIALDENDVMAIVTRHLVETCPYFKDDRIKFTQAANLPANTADHFTTIGNLYDVLTILFKEIKGGKKEHELKFIRPSDEQLQEYKDFADSFFHKLAIAFPALAGYFNADDDKTVLAKHRHSDGGHILFRPVGLRIVTEVLGGLVNHKVALDDAFKLVGKLPIELSREPYSGVIWLPAQKKVNHSKRALARELLLHMLGAAKNTATLREKYARQLGVDLDACKLPEPVV